MLLRLHEVVDEIVHVIDVLLQRRRTQIYRVRTLGAIQCPLPIEVDTIQHPHDLAFIRRTSVEGTRQARRELTCFKRIH